MAQNKSNATVSERTRAFGFYENACNLLGYAQEFVTESDVETEEDWRLVYERAEEMGFSPDQKTKRSVLMEEAVLKLGVNNGMPKVFTSYYGNAHVLERYGVVMVRIAQFAPRMVKAHQSFVQLAPSKELLAKAKEGTLKGAAWEEEYRRTILEKLIPEEVYETVLAMGRGRDVALMCYEKNGDACHRHYVSDWLNSNGYEVREFPWPSMDFSDILD